MRSTTSISFWPSSYNHFCSTIRGWHSPDWRAFRAGAVGVGADAALELASGRREGASPARQAARREELRTGSLSPTFSSVSKRFSRVARRACQVVSPRASSGALGGRIRTELAAPHQQRAVYTCSTWLTVIYTRLRLVSLMNKCLHLLTLVCTCLHYRADGTSSAKGRTCGRIRAASVHLFRP